MGCVFNFFLLSCQFFFLAAWKPEPVRPKVGYSGQLSLGFAGGQMTIHMLLPLPCNLGSQLEQPLNTARVLCEILLFERLVIFAFGSRFWSQVFPRAL